jgi:hypothetical protein
MYKYFAHLIFKLFLSVSFLFANENTAPAVFETAIEDNSYIIEEAYNQEKGIVQHIFNAVRGFTPQKEFDFSFTQEWPLWGQTSQFSYVIPYSSFNAGEISGIGDIMLNYRYQLMDHDDWCAASPRFSVIIPSGDKDKDLGSGKVGFQVNFPFSKRISNSFAMHFNAGITMIPGMKAYDRINEEEVTKLWNSYYTGASIIWLASYNLNFMFETLVAFDGEFNEKAELDHQTHFIINPGLRYAIDIGDLQIVPGLACPITFSDNETTSAVFLYLSFEHPF